jgi:6-phosphofructokinase
MSERIGILVGGGDVPGLNMCLKSLVYRLVDQGFEPIGVRKGWEGLIHYNPHDPTTYGENLIELTKTLVRPIDRTYGSFLHSSRVNPLEMPCALVPRFLRTVAAGTQDVSGHIVDMFERLGLAALIAIGDDDTLTYAAHLSQQGLPIVGIPKTIHNNITGTDYTIGFSTCLARGVAFVHELRALAGSREQVIVVETSGDASGFSTLMISFLAGVDRAVIPEVPYDPQRLAVLTMRDKSANPGNYAVVTVCEGAQISLQVVTEYLSRLSTRGRAAALRRMTVERAREIRIQSGLALDEGPLGDAVLAGSGMVAAELLRESTGEEVFLQSLTYLLETGDPDGQDLLGATNYAFLAARLVRDGKFGRMTAYQRDLLYTDIDLNVVTEGVKQVDVELMYDADNYQPKVDLIWAAQESQS